MTTEVRVTLTVADTILDRIIHDAHRLELHHNPMSKRRERLVLVIQGITPELFYNDQSNSMHNFHALCDELVVVNLACNQVKFVSCAETKRA